MSLRSFAKSKLGLVLFSSLFSLILLIAAFELISTISYYRWKEDFDNAGWFGKITVPSENPMLMWEYRPYGKNEVVGIEVNRYGFRDLDYESTAKPENTHRVAFAGDSVTLGASVRFEETFVRQFEAEAAQLALPEQLQALNFSVDGYNTIQVAELIRARVLAFSPDTVVYVMCMNDFDFTQSSGDKTRYFHKPKSFFVEVLEKAYRRVQSWFGGDFHEYFFRKNKAAVFESILELQTLLAEQNVDFRVLVLPVFPASFAEYPLEAMHQEIDAFLLENNIEYLDLLPAFQASGQSPGYYAPGIWHPNPIGHQFIAQNIAAWLFEGE